MFKNVDCKDIIIGTIILIIVYKLWKCNKNGKIIIMN